MEQLTDLLALSLPLSRTWPEKEKPRAEKLEWGIVLLVIGIFFIALYIIRYFMGEQLSDLLLSSFPLAALCLGVLEIYLTYKKQMGLIEKGLVPEKKLILERPGWGIVLLVRRNPISFLT